MSRFARTVAALPLAMLLYWIGTLGAAAGPGLARTVLPWFAILLFVVVFVGGWLGIPITGVLATVLVHEFPPRWQRRIKTLFVGWLAAWTGVALAAWLWGTPFEFLAAP